MNRRGFLGAAIAAAAGLALDPERALWTPGKKLISIPAAPRYRTALELIHLAAQSPEFRYRCLIKFPLSKAELDHATNEFNGMLERWGNEFDARLLEAISRSRREC